MTSLHVLSLSKFEAVPQQGREEPGRAEHTVYQRYLALPPPPPHTQKHTHARARTHTQDAERDTKDAFRAFGARVSVLGNVESVHWSPNGEKLLIFSSPVQQVI